MAVVVKHKKTVQKPDGTDESVVRPSDWNDGHAVQLTGPALLGKDDLGNGDAEEIAIGDGLKLENGQLKVDPNKQYVTRTQADQDYATAAQGGAADSAVQPEALNNYYTKTQSDQRYPVLVGGLVQDSNLPNFVPGTQKMFFSAAALGLLTGASTTAQFAQTTAKVCAPNTRTAYDIQLPLKGGVLYQAYAVWGVDNATAGNISWYSGVHIYLEGQAVSGGAGLKTYLKSPALNTVYRTAISSVKGVENATYNFYVDRRGADSDTYPGNVLLLGIEIEEIAAISEAKITSQISIPATKFATPFNGLRYSSIYGGGMMFTPITSDANHIYIVEPLAANTNQSGVAKLNKATKALVQQGVLNQSIAHDASLPGHNAGSVGLTAAGTLLMHPCGHYAPLVAAYALNGDLSNIVAIAAPTGVENQSSYRRFFSNPANGEMWLSCRGNNYSGQVYKWDEASKTFSRPTALNFATGSTEYQGGTYGGQMAFKSATEHFIATSWINAGVANRYSGYPRRNGSVLISSNNGGSYNSVNGYSMYLPAAEGGDHRVAFPTDAYNATMVEGGVVVCADGRPGVFASWQHANSKFREPWFAKWDGQKFIRQRLYKSLGQYSVGAPESTFINGGRIAIVFGEVEDYDAAGQSGAIPAAYGVTNLVCMFTDDNGSTWTKANIGLKGNWSGAYIDRAEFLRSNGKTLRLLGRDILEGVNASYIYEATLP